MYIFGRPRAQRRPKCTSRCRCRLLCPHSLLFLLVGTRLHFDICDCPHVVQTPLPTPPPSFPHSSTLHQHCTLHIASTTITTHFAAMGNRRQFIAAASDTPSKRMKTTVKHTQSANTAAGAQTSTMPGSHVTPPSPSPLSFFDKIPAEIRVLIYELVYAGEKPLKVKPTVPVRLRKVCRQAEMLY